MKNPDTHIIIFAKAPIAGFAKTRLIPALGEQGAASLAKQLLDYAVCEALSSKVKSVEICVTPAIEHAYWHDINLPHDVAISSQGEGDLGQRMARAAKRALDRHQYVLLMGTDCPELTQLLINYAIEVLACHDACLAPVLDGGYALMGLSAFDSSLFQDIPWSTDQVSALTLERFRMLGWQVAHLKELHDIDEAEDLKFLTEHFKASFS